MTSSIDVKQPGASQSVTGAEFFPPPNALENTPKARQTLIAGGSTGGFIVLSHQTRVSFGAGILRSYLSATLDSLPNYLSGYVLAEDLADYTGRDQLVLAGRDDFLLSIPPQWPFDAPTLAQTRVLMARVAENLRRLSRYVRDPDIQHAQTVLNTLAFAEPPLEEVTRVLGLSPDEVAKLFNARPGVDTSTWYKQGPPTEIQQKVNIVRDLCRLLEYEFTADAIKAAARRPAPAYNNLTMLEMIEQDRETELLATVRRSLDFSRSL